MSFEIDPALYDYEAAPNVCPGCFGAGKTNASVFACVTGIEFGLAVPGVAPDPPNGVFEMGPIGPCVFFSAAGGYRFDWIFGVDPSSFSISVPFPFVYFISSKAGTCKFTFTNSLIDPALNQYVNGQVVVVPPLTCNIENMQDLWSSLGEDPKVQTFSTPRPKSASETTFTVSRRRDATNIHILQEIP